MPQLILDRQARLNYQHLVAYLAETGAVVQAITVAELLDNAFDFVAQYPKIGKMFDTATHIREYFVKYGKAGYSFLYHYDEQNDIVVILTIKHYRQQQYNLYS